MLKLVRIGKPYLSPVWFTSPVQNKTIQSALQCKYFKQTLQTKDIDSIDRINTCNVIHYLSVSSARNVKELIDVGADSVTLLGAHVQAPLQVGGVIINHCLDLLEDQVKPEGDTNI